VVGVVLAHRARLAGGTVVVVMLEPASRRTTVVMGYAMSSTGATYAQRALREATAGADKLPAAQHVHH